DNLIKKIEEAKNMISKSKEAEILKIEIEKRQMDEKIRLEIAKEKGIREGEEKGMKKGIKKGIKEGIKEGEEKGIEKEKINFAFKLKNKGFSFEEISEMTELSFEKLKNLISNT
ncbi:MAG: hypothetical protein LBT66_04475, partial [Methanobrevibacter sp.]|nr:hypothetical protein [Candidatus Methanovirga meridionalis]